jgi:hypothetical protein
MRIMCFRLDTVSMIDAHFRLNFISVNSSVVRGILINLLFNLNTRHSRWPPRTRIIDTPPPSLESFYSFVNFPLAHTVITLNCHYSANFTSFQTHHHHHWRYSPESGLGLPYRFRDRYITMWVISPTINLVLVILIQPPEISSGEATIDI